MTHTKFSWANGDLIEAGSPGTKGLNNLEEQYDDAMADVDARLMFSGHYTAGGTLKYDQMSNATWISLGIFSDNWAYEANPNGVVDSSGVFTPPVAGLYLVSGVIKLAAGAYSGEIGVRLQDALGGVVVERYASASNVADGPTVSFSEVLLLAVAPATYRLACYQNSGGAKALADGSQHTRFSAQLLART